MVRTRAILLLTAALTLLAAHTATGAEDVKGYVDPAPASDDPFQAQWKHVSETTAVIYWHVAGLSKEATGSYVEYGETDKYGQRTKTADRPTTTKVRDPNSRWAHLHWIKGLEPGKTYHYRTVMTLDGKKVTGKDLTFETKKVAGAVYLPGDLKGPPYTLDKPNTTYVLTKDVTAPATAIIIDAPGVTLDLDGHTVTFGDDTDKAADGVATGKKATGKVIVRNGHIRQGKRCGVYSCAVGTRWRAYPLEVCGISTDVHLKCAYPMRVFGRGKDVDIHHNHLYSRTTDIASRHYPGNDLLRIDDATNVKVHHNLLTEGCHRGISLRSPKDAKPGNAEVYANDVRHHQQYVNGHAFVGMTYARVHHNHVTSTGRGMQIGSDVQIDHNWFDLQGHMTLSDMPAGSRPWKQRRVELHGFKFEGKGCVNVKIHDNFMRITQHQPKGKWDYVPATPLNVGCYHPNAMNEVCGNTIVALTTYKKTRHGGYGASGQWASAIHLIGMTHGPAEAGKYSIYIHDNKFISNDLFVSNNGNPNMTIRIEKNAFVLGDNPTEGHTVFSRRMPEAVRQAVKKGGNTFKGMKP